VVATHVEGPFLAAVRRGAHSEALIVAPTRERVDALLDAAVGGPRLLVTLAPEVDGAIAAIGRLVERGALVSVGHTDARAAQVTAALDAGARMVTHLFNAQRGLHHREPGVVGAALTDPRATCGLIVDLHHVAPAVCRIAFAAAPGRIALVSDAVAAAGMPPGRYELGGRPVELGESGPPLRADGTIAGADLSLSRALANAVALGVDLVDAVRAASTVPADALGRSELGRLRPGSRADFAWLGEDLDVRATWIDGRLAHGSADPSAPGDRELVGVSR
jgi:N-acetylglucosamine-6-phosphate deacetylase